jgi:hypothetical protein
MTAGNATAVVAARTRLAASRWVRQAGGISRAGAGASDTPPARRGIESGGDAGRFAARK